MVAKDRIIVALDVATTEKATELAQELAPHVGAFKVGLELIQSMWAELLGSGEREAAQHLKAIRRFFKLCRGRIFWDGKFDDIPNTVAGAARATARCPVQAFNVHASAGGAVVRAAVANRGVAAVYGVTVLTSLDELECISIFGATPENKVRQFAAMLVDAGAQGIICSPRELAVLATDRNFRQLFKITPGVRPLWAAAGDQKRVMTPAEAIRAGADYLVIGRPITMPPKEIGAPVDAAKRIAEEIAAA